MGKTFKHIDLQQRLKLKEMLDSGCSILEVANALEVHRSAVYRELERGGGEGGYDPYYAQSLYEGRLKKKGRPECKLSNKDLAEYISGLILTEHLSPEKIVLVLINDIRFKGKKRKDWKEVEDYLKEYVGEFYEIAETSEKIFISGSFPDEYAGSESRLALKGAVAKAKANAAQGIPELIRIATNGEYSENTKKKHEKDAKYGWYRYDVRFALPVYDEERRGMPVQHFFCPDAGAP